MFSSTAASAFVKEKQEHINPGAEEDEGASFGSR